MIISDKQIIELISIAHTLKAIIVKSAAQQQVPDGWVNQLRAIDNLLNEINSQQSTDLHKTTL